LRRQRLGRSQSASPSYSLGVETYFAGQLSALLVATISSCRHPYSIANDSQIPTTLSQHTMASQDTEKSGALPGPVPHLSVTMPDKAVLSDSASSTLSPSRDKSFDVHREESAVSTPRSYQNSNPFDTDIEAMVPTHTQESCARKSTTVERGDCQVWPGKDHWKQKAKAAKMDRSCRCMARLSKRTRIVVKILIGLLIVGIAVGVGFGVSKPLGAPIWGKKQEG